MGHASGPRIPDQWGRALAPSHPHLDLGNAERACPLPMKADWAGMSIISCRLILLRVKLRRTGTAPAQLVNHNSGNANRLAAAVGECCKWPSARRPRKDRKQNPKQSLVAGDCDGKVCPFPAIGRGEPVRLRRVASRRSFSVIGCGLYCPRSGAGRR
jgi:hypothetical protein